jgi:hypothetical protein
MIGCTITFSGLAEPTEFAPTIQPTPSKTLVNKTSNLVNGTIKVGTLRDNYYDVPLSVSNNMRNPVVSGSFTASGGSGNDIIVYLFDDREFFARYHNKKSYVGQVIYDSGQVTTGTINVPVPVGSLHLVLDNRFSVISSKQVSAKIDLQWSELESR